LLAAQVLDHTSYSFNFEVKFLGKPTVCYAVVVVFVARIRKWKRYRSDEVFEKNQKHNRVEKKYKKQPR